jgi:triosephosphate isomerase (TIM)
MRTSLVAGNWKMNGSFAANASLLQSLLKGLAKLDSSRQAVCVPYPYLEQVRGMLNGSRIAWGAQNVSEFEAGAYTGEVAAPMLREFGCSYVTVGHSERRMLFAEGDVQVAAKYAAALGAGITPILCVGETLEERERGVTEQVVRRQLGAVMDKVGAAGIARGVVAYEPVWAIGTGRTASAETAQQVHAFLRGCVAADDPAVAAGLAILYGGSVKAQNAAELFAMADIDGGLIGGASLKADEFIAICQFADELADR